MSLLSLSLIAKVGIGIGLVSLATSVPLSVVKKEKKSFEVQQAKVATPNRSKESAVNLDDEVSQKVLDELVKRSCYESYKDKKENKLGTLYICKSNSSQEKQVQEINSESDWGYLLFVDNEAVIKHSGDIDNISVFLKKVVSIVYEGDEVGTKGKVIFKLEQENDKRTLIVDYAESWKYFEIPARFTEMEGYLTSIYNTK